MSTGMKIIGFLATLVILLIVPVYMFLEPTNQQNQLYEYQTTAVLISTDLYAENCAICHGASGEGIGGNPALNSDAIRTMDSTELFKTIERGRPGTQMAAWSLDEGGIFTTAQISDMVTMIQVANWDYVAQQIDYLGLTPPQMIEFEVSEEMASAIASLPDGATLELGLSVYGANCAACHGSNGAGTVIAPAIDNADLRAMPSGDLLDIINNGVMGTLMSAWNNTLSEEEKGAVISLIYRWPEILQAGIEFPEVEIVSFASTPEMVAAGNQLFHITCKSCHGVDGYGTAMAPALNNSIFLSETPDAAIYQIIAGGVSGTLMPAWGSRLSDQDIQNLVAFLRSFEETAPPIVPPIVP